MFCVSYFVPQSSTEWNQRWRERGESRSFQSILLSHGSLHSLSTSWIKWNQHCGLCDKYRPGSLSLPRRLTRTETFTSWGFSVSGIITPYLYPLERWNVLAQISLLGLRRLIWVYTLRRSHNVGFLAGRLIFYLLHWLKISLLSVYDACIFVWLYATSPLELLGQLGWIFISSILS